MPSWMTSDLGGDVADQVDVHALRPGVQRVLVPIEPAHLAPPAGRIEPVEVSGDVRDAGVRVGDEGSEVHPAIVRVAGRAEWTDIGAGDRHRMPSWPSQSRSRSRFPKTP
jgi:hypothetical protein